MTRTSIIAMSCTLAISASSLSAVGTKVVMTPDWYRQLLSEPFLVAPEAAKRDIWWENVSGFQFDARNPERSRKTGKLRFDFHQSVDQRRTKLLERGRRIATHRAQTSPVIRSSGDQIAPHPTAADIR